MVRHKLCIITPLADVEEDDQEATPLTPPRYRQIHNVSFSASSSKPKGQRSAIKPKKKPPPLNLQSSPERVETATFQVNPEVRLNTKDSANVQITSVDDSDYGRRGLPVEKSLFEKIHPSQVSQRDLTSESNRFHYNTKKDAFSDHLTWNTIDMAKDSNYATSNRRKDIALTYSVDEEDKKSIDFRTEQSNGNYHLAHFGEGKSNGYESVSSHYKDNMASERIDPNYFSGDGYCSVENRLNRLPEFGSGKLQLSDTDRLSLHGANKITQSFRLNLEKILSDVKKETEREIQKILSNSSRGEDILKLCEPAKQKPVTQEQAFRTHTFNCETNEDHNDQQSPQYKKEFYKPIDVSTIFKDDKTVNKAKSSTSPRFENLKKSLVVIEEKESFGNGQSDREHQSLGSSGDRLSSDMSLSSSDEQNKSGEGQRMTFSNENPKSNFQSEVRKMTDVVFVDATKEEEEEKSKTYIVVFNCV